MQHLLVRLPPWALLAVIIAATVVFVTLMLTANLILLPIDIAIGAVKGTISP